MSKVIFSFEKIDTTMSYSKNDLMKDICENVIYAIAKADFKDSEGALELYKRAIEEYPDQMNAYILVGNMYHVRPALQLDLSYVIFSPADREFRMKKTDSGAATGPRVRPAWRRSEAATGISHLTGDSNATIPTGRRPGSTPAM